MSGPGSGVECVREGGTRDRGGDGATESARGGALALALELLLSPPLLPLFHLSPPILAIAISLSEAPP